MASKKNPFASILQSGRRVQAADFNKDYTVTSTVGQAGNYAIGFTRPIPISETSMGRLAQALGQTSGILKEFSDYQIKKDQLALQKQQLATQLEGQGIAAQQAELELENAKLRGAMTNETIKQQNIRLEMMQEQYAVAEEEAAYRNMSPQQQEEYNASLMRNVEVASANRDKAELTAFNTISRSGDTKAKESIERIKALRRTGSALIPEWNVFAQQEFEKRMAQVTDAFTEEEAFAMGQEILQDFVEQQGLEEGSIKAQGFYSSVYNLNKEKFATMADKAIQKTEGLKFESKTYDLLNVATDGNGILTHTQFLDLENAAADGSFFKLLLGQDGKSGLLGRVKNTRDPEVLENFKSMHEAMGYMSLDGKSYKETEEYSEIDADIEDAIDEAKSGELIKKNNEAKLRDKKVSGLMLEESLGPDSKIGKAARLQGVFQAIENREADGIRTALAQTFPLLSESGVLDEIPDDELSVTAFNMSQQYMDFADNQERYLGQFLQEHSEFYPVKTDLPNARDFLTEVRDAMAAFPNKENAQRTLSTILDGGFTMTEYHSLNKGTDGAFSDYAEDIRKIQKETINTFDDLYSKEARDFLNQKLQQADQKLSKRIDDYFMELEASKTAIKEQNVFNIKNIGGSLDQQQGLETAAELQTKLLADKLKAYERTRKAADASVLSEKELSSKSKQHNMFLQKTRADLEQSRKTLKEAGTVLLKDFGFDNEDSIDSYKFARSYHEIIETRKAIAGVTGKEALDFAKSSLGFKNSDRVPVVLINEQYNSQPTTRPAGPAGGVFGSGFEEDEKYAKGQIKRAESLLQDVTIDKDVFMKYIPPLTDLQFGKSTPSSEEDITRAVEQLEGVDSKEDLQKIANLFGFESSLEFLQSQYKTLYHISRNKLNKQ